MGGGCAPILPCIIRPAGRNTPMNGIGVEGYCCIDTGSRVTIIDLGVMEHLQIEPSSTLGAVALGPASRTAFRAPVFAARMEFPGSNLEPLVLGDFVGAAVQWDEPDLPGKPIIALLGRSALVNYVMIYNGPESSITLIRRT
jgi:hypothetical protein